MKYLYRKLVDNRLFFLTCIGFIILYILTKSPHLLFIGNIILITLIIIKSKFSYFSLKTIVVNYLLIPVFFQYTTGKSYGILESSSLKLHYTEIMYIILIYNLLCYLWLKNSCILYNEKELLKNQFNITKISANCCSIIAIISSIIALPSLPFSFNTNRLFASVLPGNAWNHLAIVALMFACTRIKDSTFVKISTAFVIFWFMSHFERVDIIGFLIGIILISCIIKDIKIKFPMLLKYIFLLFSILFVMVAIGELRTGNFKDFSFLQILRKMVIQNTAADLGYVFNCGIEYFHKHSLLLGKSYITYLIESIPLLNSKYRIELILASIYHTPGGDFILNEPLMNFGLIGIVLFQTIEFTFLKWVVSKNTKYRYFIYLFFIITVFRTIWYGLIYIETAMIYFIPIIYILTKIIDGKITDKNGLFKAF